MTRHQEVYNEDYALSLSAHSVGVRVLVLVDVVCVMLDLISRVDFCAVCLQFS